jgi:hypothetical protein
MIDTNSGAVRVSTFSAKICLCKRAVTLWTVEGMISRFRSVFQSVHGSGAST